MRWLRGRLALVDYKYLVASAFIFGLFMELLDLTIVNVALPRLAVDFNATTGMLEWVITGYLLSLAVWIPASGWIGDRFGTKKTFLFATAAFVFGSALCGLAWSIESLVIFRVIQGVGGGMMTPVGTAMLYRAFTPAERARASAILSVPTMIAPMLGPVFGGFLVDQASWRWIFYVNVPVGVASLIFSAMVLKEHTERAGRFDPKGFLLSGAGIAGILYALSKGPEDGWTSMGVLVTGIGGLICFVLLILVETRILDPMLDLALYKARMFRVGSVVAFMFFATQFGLLFLLPLYLQGMRGLSAFESGLTTFPQPIGQILMIQVTSRLYSRLGPRRNMVISSAGLTVTACLFLLVDLQTSVWWVRGIIFLRGCFIAFNMVSLQTAVFSAVPRPRMGRGTSLFSTQRQVAAAFGVAVFGTVLSARTQTLMPASAAPTSPLAHMAGLLAFHDTVAVVALFGLIGLVFALQVRDHDIADVQRTAAQQPSTQGTAATAS